MSGVDFLKQELGDTVKEGVPFSSLTTLGIGGPARLFIEANNEEGLKQAANLAKKHAILFIIISGGSNLLVNDDGYNGLVIKVNIAGIKQEDGAVRVMAGTNLGEFVDFCNSHGLSGLEKLTGIPGSVGGAICGNAGAYGQTISDKLIRVRVFNREKDYWLTKKGCKFDYRESGFKEKKGLIILEAEFKTDEGNPETLQKISQETVKKRQEKYLPGTKCPGSFFKNVLLEKLPKHLQNEMPKDYYGKVPAWYFLEKVGAKGQKRGGIKIADYHANLFINEGGGKASDFFKLAKEYKNKVKEKFGVDLEPEVQLIGFSESL